MSCSKVPHPTKKAATDAMNSLRRRQLGGIRMNAEVYKCGDHWHFGHYNPKKRKRGRR